MKSERLVLVLSGLVVIISLLVIVGWIFNISVLMSVLPGFISMKANTAFTFLALGLATWMLRHDHQNLKITLLAQFLCVFSAVIGILTLCEYLFQINFGIDELIFTDFQSSRGRFPAGRLAPITAINFILLPVALFLTSLKKKRFALAQFMVIVCLFSGLQALIGYSIGMSYTFGSAFYTQMAVHTSVCFILVSFSILLSRPDVGFMKALTARTKTASMIRWLLAAVTLIPPFTKWVSQRGLQAQMFDQDFATLIQVVGNIVLTTFIVLITAKTLYEVDEKRTEALQLESEARAKAEKALLTRNHFLSIASHELKTPLMALQLQNEFLQHQLQKDDIQMFSIDKLKKRAVVSERQITWLHYLVKEMLDVSRIDSGQLVLDKKIVDIFMIAKNVVQQQTDTTQGQLQINLTGEVALLNCDAFQIEQLFSSLLSNAVKYGQKKPIDIAIKNSISSVEIDVRDLGLGIAPQDQKRIFERFERALSENEVSGLGLGLFIAKEIVTAHGGTISVRSRLSEGATFNVLLPKH